MPGTQTKDIKSAARQLVDSLPDDVTWDDVMYRVYVRQAIDAGRQDAAEGDCSTWPKFGVSSGCRNESSLDKHSDRASGLDLRVHCSRFRSLSATDGRPNYVAISQVARFPRSGQMGPEYQDPDIREDVEGQYRVIYEITASEIHVLAVIHGAQLLPPEPPRETSA